MRQRAVLYPGSCSVELGPGADHYVGADFAETVYGAGRRSHPGATPSSTSSRPAAATTGSPQGRRGRGPTTHLDGRRPRHRQVRWTPPGRRSTTVRIPTASCSRSAWDGDLAVDNVARRATIGDSTVLTWTSVDTFSMRAVPARQRLLHRLRRGRGRSTSSTSVLDLAAPAQITTGGGDDSVGLETYLPASVDLGEGYDSLTYLACHRAYVSLAVSAECLTSDGRRGLHGPRGDRVLPRPDGRTASPSREPTAPTA